MGIPITLLTKKYQKNPIKGITIRMVTVIIIRFW